MQDKRKERIDRGVKVRSDTIYAISSPKEIMYLLGPRLGLIIILAVLPLVLPLYWQKVMTVTAVYALLAVGFGFLSSYVGLVNLGGALFVGAGGYISGILNTDYGLGMYLSIPIATVLGAVICTLLLLPCLPLRGIYFAIVSFVYPLAAVRIIAAFNILGGTDGITGLDIIRTGYTGQYIILSILILATIGISRLVNAEDIGLIFRGVKDNEQAIKASGINITVYKAVGVFITALLGCFAGAWQAHMLGTAGMSLMATDYSILPLAATVVGGVGSIYGPLVGTYLLVPISEALRDFGTMRIVFYSVVMVFFVVFWTEGIITFLKRKYEQFERWVRV